MTDPNVSWTALVLAGSRPTADPFAAAHGATTKALVPIAGRPMIVYPVEALLAVPAVAAVRVLGQEPERLASALADNAGLSCHRARGSIAEALLALCDDPATPWPMLVTTADQAVLEPSTVIEFMQAALPCDVAIGCVERRSLLARFPLSRRTWLKFRGGAYSGANLFALTSPRAKAVIRQWQAVEQDRKKGWRVIAQFGLPLLLGAVLRLRTIHQTADALGRRLGITLRVVVLSDPLAAIDVDKQCDLDLVEQIMAGRA